MHKIEWSNDLSVGVELIDNDHKELIAIINKIIDEVANKDLLMDHFDELEDYTRYHFSREEKLMVSQCLTDEDRAMVKEHIKEHQLFIKKIPELKKKIEFASSSDISFEVIDFLVSWLLDHIIVKDLFLAQCFTFNKPTLKDKTKNFFSLFVERINKTLSLYTKVLLLVAIPLLLVFGLLFYQSSTTYKKYHKLGEIEDISESFIAVNTLINSLQKERGYSNGWITSKYISFKKELLDQRKFTSELIIKCKPRFEKLKKYADTTSVIQELDKIEAIRKKIDTKQLNRDEIKKYYTNLINMSIETIKDTGHLYKDKINSSLIILFYLKENAGILRKEGLQLLLENSDPIEFKKHIIRREGYKESLNLLASDTLLKRLKKIDESNYSATIMEMEKSIVKDNNTKYINEAKWFEINSVKIDAYAQVIKNKLEIINSRAKHKKETYLFYMGILWLFSLLVLLISFILMHALRQSIVKPVEEITTAMQNLTKGNKSFYFNTYKKDDLIGKMVIAFNNLRRHMIKSDYTEALLDVKDKKVENYEKLSYIDPLTSIFNRRKYIESLKIAIEKSNKLGNALSLLAIDLDRFKHINDSFGHDVGDHILKVFADSLKQTVKDSGIVTRIGGEEFAVIIPDVSREKAIEMSEKILKSTRELDFSSMHKNILLTVSIGIAMYKNNSTVDEFIKTADENLYQAKNTGRNRVC